MLKIADRDAVILCIVTQLAKNTFYPNSFNNHLARVNIIDSLKFSFLHKTVKLFKRFLSHLMECYVSVGYCTELDPTLELT